MFLRKKIFTAIILGAALLCFPNNVQAAEKITNFSTRIKINSDASVTVTETIVYDFGTLEKHGIYREIPTVYATDSGKRKLKFSKINVADSAGNERPFNVSYPKGMVSIKIGDPNRLITGEQVYVIHYTVKGAVNYFKDHDELYWNATGNDWPVPINSAGAVFVLPKPVLLDKLLTDCYVGALYGKDKCLSNQLFNQTGDTADGVIFGHTNLSSGSGLTGVIGFPKGLVVTPNKYLSAVKDFWPFILPVIAFVTMFYLWWTRGRDPEGRKIIIPEYEVPDNLTPIELGTIYDSKHSNRDVSAEIIYLATKGYLKITRLETKKTFGRDGIDYELEKLKEDGEELNDYDRYLLTALFGKEKMIKISSLKEKFFKEYQQIGRKVWDTVVKNGYYDKSPAAARRGYALICFVAVFILTIFKTVLISSLGGLAVASFYITILIVLIFAFLMPARTKKGVLMKERILGLKMYLGVAEKDRLAFHNAPEKNPELFDSFLPYAMALGVEEAWASQFQEIYREPPNWYSGGVGRNFSASMFASDMADFNSKGVGEMVTVPSKSGRSGLGGRGFSGGGFGGGGGRSW